MKKVYKIFSLLFILIAFVTLASCSSGPNINAVMEYTASATKIKINCTFEANSLLETGDAVPSIREYSYDSDGNEKYETYEKIVFEKSNTSASVEFVGLERSTKYLFKMYVTYESVDTYVTEIEASTASYDDDAPIEIKTTEEFIQMENDPEANYVLKNDLDFSSVSSTNLDLFASETTPFEGTFDGNGHTISNYKLTSNSAKYYGIFGYTKKAKISNLNVTNVSLESTNKGSFSCGSLIGQADSTEVENVKVNGVNFKIGFSSSEENVGGIVGLSKKSTFTNTEVKNFTFESAQLRGKLNIGLFAGEIDGEAVGTKEINGVTESISINQCGAEGSIKAAIKNTTSNDGFIRIGGFVGHVNASSSYIYNAYANADINVYKIASSGNVEDNYDFYVGGFLGSCDGGLVLSKCYSKNDINVSSTGEITPESTPEDIAKANETPICNKLAYIGSFIGKLSYPIGLVKDCCFDSNFREYIGDSHDASNDDRATFERIKDKKIDELPVGTSVQNNEFRASITGKTDYYTLTATKVTIDEETFNAGTYYTKDGNNYIHADTYNSEAEYYNIVSALDETVNSNTDFSGENYYTFDDSCYNLATSYTKKAVKVYYAWLGVVYGYSYTTSTEKINNVDTSSSTADLTQYEEYVRDYINSLDDKN